MTENTESGGPVQVTPQESIAGETKNLSPECRGPYSLIRVSRTRINFDGEGCPTESEMDPDFMILNGKGLEDLEEYIADHNEPIDYLTVKVLAKDLEEIDLRKILGAVYGILEGEQ